MTVNFTMLAQNSTHNYVKQAYLCALSIRATNPDSKICLITNDTLDKKHSAVFDDIVSIPWEDSAQSSEWKVENRWKIYHATPYDRTIVIDTDMLVLENVEHWWNFLKNYKIFFTTNVKTYRGTPLTSIYYRKAFRNHQLPNLYSGFHYFEKSDEAHNFYKWLELVMNNWELFYGQYAGGKYWKILTSERWQDKVGVYLDNDLDLKIGNYKQNGIFHYTEKDFVTDDVIKIYERYLNV